MKKTYFAPEMEIVKLNVTAALLQASQSGETPGFGGQGDPNDPDDDPA